MKRLLIRLLAIVGLAPARSYRAVTAQLRDTESKARRLAKAVEELKASTQVWKTKASEAVDRAKSLDLQTRHHAKLALVAEKERRRSVASVQKRLIAAERELAMTREHLMATEVKLDILEGAANVLDARMRTVLSRQPGQTGAPV